jgi:hypothetical protein
LVRVRHTSVTSEFGPDHEIQEEYGPDLSASVADGSITHKKLAKVRRRVNLTDAWTEDDIAGTGSSAVDDTAVYVASGATAASTASRHVNGVNGISRGVRFDKLDWSRPLTIWARYSVLASAANGTVQITLGKGLTDGVGNQARRGICIIRYSNLTPLVTVHDGTTLTVPTMTTAPVTVAADIHDVRVESDGDGTVRWYIDDVQVSSTTAGPSTVTPNVDENLWQIECSNGASAANVSLALFDLQWED